MRNTPRPGFFSLLAASTLALTLHLHAVPLVEWDFTGAPGNLPVAGTSFNVGVVAANSSFGIDISPTPIANTMSAALWTSGTVPANDDYFGFSFSIDADTTLSLEILSFSERRAVASNGPRSFQLQYSFTGTFIPGSPLIIATQAIPLDTDIHNWSFSLGEAFADLTNTTVYFRIYGYNRVTGGGGSTWSLVDSVSVTAVPEPGTCFLLGAGFLGFLLKARSKRRDS